MKKLLAVVLSMVLVLSFSTMSFAKSSNVDDFVSKANSQVKGYLKSVEISLVSEKDYKKVEAEVERANAQIIKFVEKEIDAKNVKIDKLVEKTNSIAFRTIEKAAKLGIEVECEYEVYEIAGQTVYIDPLRVVRR